MPTLRRVKISRSCFDNDLMLIAHFPEANEDLRDKKIATIHSVNNDEATWKNARLMASAHGLREVVRAMLGSEVRAYLPPDILSLAERTVEFIEHGPKEPGHIF